MVFVESLAQDGGGEQKSTEFFREYIIFGHGIPDLTGHFGFKIGRQRDFTEVAIRHVFDFVVVIKHHASVTGDAKVLPQHVAGENVGLSQFANGAAVFLATAIDKDMLDSPWVV